MGVERSTRRDSFGDKAELLAALEDMIRSGRLAPGQRLPSERDLGIEYKLSRPVIREALRGLAERGYIEVHPGRGSFVRAPETADLAVPLMRIATNAGVTPRDLVEAREVLEGAAARRAAMFATAEQIGLIAETLETHERAVSLPDRASTDLAFHTAIADASGNYLLSLMFGSIKSFAHGLMLRSHSDRMVREIGDPLHQEILDCIRDRNPDGAETAMRHHISLALELFGEDLDRPLADVLALRGINAEALG